MATGYTTVSATKLSDSSGNLISNAVITFTPCSTSGAPISFQVGGGGQASNAPVSAPVTNGAFSIQLADSTLTEPQNVCYRVQVQGRTFSAGNPPVQLLGPGYLIQPSGATWSLDGFVPNLATLALIQTGPQGPQGIPGALSGNYTGPLTVSPSFGIRGFSFEQSAVLAALGLVECVSDYSGQISEGTSLSGVKQFFAGVKVLNGLFADLVKGNSVQALSFQQQDSLTQGTISTALGLIDCITDFAGNVSEGTSASGMKQFFAGVKVLNGLAADLVKGNSVQAGTVSASSFQQVDALTQETPPNAYGFADCTTDFTGNVVEGTRLDGTKFLAGDLIVGGNVFANSALSQHPSTSLNLANTGMLVFTVGGQSLAAGYGATIVSGAQKYNGLSLTGGPRVHIAQGQAPATADMASLVPLVQDSDSVNPNLAPGGSGTFGETCSSGFVEMLSLLLATIGLTTPVAVAINSFSGQAYQNIQKGTQTYANGVTYVQSFKALAAGSINCLSRLFIHGETDDALVNTQYEANLVSEQANTNADYTGVTGQSNVVPLQFCQMSSWAVQGRATPTTPLAQLAAAEDHPTTHCLVGPKYQYAYQADGLHIDGKSQYYNGERHAKAAFGILSGTGWTGVRPKPGFPIRMGKYIFVEMYVPFGPLVIDTALVTQPNFVTGSMYGFEFNDGSSAPPAIVAVDIVKGTMVRLTLAALPAPPSGATMYASYAYTATTGSLSGFNSGPRGNLRDSDPTLSTLDASPLYNWCATFHKPVS